MDQDELINQLDSFEKQVTHYDDDSRNGKELWLLKNELFEAFKTVRFPTKSERQDAWSKYINISNELKFKQEQINRAGEKYAEKADDLLRNVSDLISPELFKSELTKENYQEIREKLNEAFQQLKHAHWPSKQDRERAWEKFHSLKNESKEKEDQFYNERKERFNRKQEHSAELTEKILRALKACHPDSSDDLTDVLGKLLLYLSGIGIIIDFLEGLFGIKDEREKDPLREKSAALKEIRKTIHESLPELFRDDRSKIFDELDRVQLALNDAWSERKEERTEKQRAWEENQRNFIQMLEEKLERKEGSKEKMEKVLENQKDFLPRLEKRLENQKEYLQKVNEELGEWEDKYNEAWTDSFRDKASDIVDSKKEKIREVEQSIEEIESKISEVENSINELESKTENFDSDLDSLRDKIREAKSRLNR